MKPRQFLALVLALVLPCSPALLAGPGPTVTGDSTNNNNRTEITNGDSRETTLLVQIWRAVVANGGGSSGGTPGASGTVVTPTITVVTASGTVAAGSRGVQFVLSGDFVGTILGAPYRGAGGSGTNGGAVDAAQPFTPPPGCTEAAIAYTITTGSIRIVDQR